MIINHSHKLKQKKIKIKKSVIIKDNIIQNVFSMPKKNKKLKD